MRRPRQRLNNITAHAAYAEHGHMAAGQTIHRRLTDQQRFAGKGFLLHGMHSSFA